MKYQKRSVAFYFIPVLSPSPTPVSMVALEIATQFSGMGFQHRKTAEQSFFANNNNVHIVFWLPSEGLVQSVCLSFI